MDWRVAANNNNTLTLILKCYSLTVSLAHCLSHNIYILPGRDFHHQFVEADSQEFLQSHNQRVTWTTCVQYRPLSTSTKLERDISKIYIGRTELVCDHLICLHILLLTLNLTTLFRARRDFPGLIRSCKSCI